MMIHKSKNGGKYKELNAVVLSDIHLGHIPKNLNKIVKNRKNVAYQQLKA
jgi:hypothetical protein